MKLKPYVHQIAGGQHLAARKVAALFDDPRVGKTLATILALDKICAKRVLVVTTVSGRAIIRQAFADNQTIPRRIQIISPKEAVTGDLVIASWAGINNAMLRTKLLAQRWEVLVLDESHYAKSPTAKRTQAVYGVLRLDGHGLDQTKALTARAARTWLLTGTPIPHDLSDLYPAMRALTPELLAAHNGMPDVMTLSRFIERYCVRKLIKPTPRFSKWVVIGGKNESELKARLNGGQRFALRRTQEQIGILEPRHSLRPLIADDADQIPEAGMSREEIEEILASQRYSDKGLARLMHLHGIVKARAVAEAVHEEINCGLDRIVLGYWHRDVGDILRSELAEHGVVGIDGATPFNDRARVVQQFSTLSGPKIFLQQIAAAGESIDLSASQVLWFVESIFQPGAMKQASERVVNLNNRRAPIVETCFISGTIDEIIQGRLMSLWSAINKVIK
jgi:SNF2 family DNA or RNA helicase